MKEDFFEFNKSTKTDDFESPDFYLLDDLLSTEHLIIRKSVRDFVKKEIAAKAEQEKLNALAAEEKEKQRIIIFSIAGALLLVVFFSVFARRSR